MRLHPRQPAQRHHLYRRHVRPARALYKHREGLTRGFAAEHRADRLVHYEMLDTMAEAIRREKQLKAWRRAWKVALIEEQNPFREDRAIDLGFESVAPHPATLAPSSRT